MEIQGKLRNNSNVGRHTKHLGGAYSVPEHVSVGVKALPRDPKHKLIFSLLLRVLMKNRLMNLLANLANHLLLNTKDTEMNSTGPTGQGAPDPMEQADNYSTE